MVDHYVSFVMQKDFGHNSDRFGQLDASLFDASEKDSDEPQADLDLMELLALVGAGASAATIVNLIEGLPAWGPVAAAVAGVAAALMYQRHVRTKKQD